MIINVDFDDLKHDIVETNDGVVILCPMLLASDVANDLYFDDFYNDEEIPIDDIIFACKNKLNDIIFSMSHHVQIILKENDKEVL